MSLVHAPPRTTIRQEAREGVRLRGLGSWHHLSLAAILALSAVLNMLWLNRQGYTNTYYAAAVRSMMESFHTFFFVSFDPGGFVTVDKPPAGFWVQTAFAKLLGFHGWSILLPQALAGVGSVALMYLLVRRGWGLVAGLLAALGMAVTPVAVAVNRNNTIDSLLVFTLLLAVWAVLTATRGGRLRWLLVGMALVGVGFNIKMLQAYFAVPALALVYLVGAPRGLWTRLWHLAVSGVVLITVSFAWIAAVELTPADQRPYIGSSQHNSALELALGYNGLQRLLGMQRGSSPPAAAAADTVTSSSGADTAVAVAAPPSDSTAAGTTDAAPAADAGAAASPAPPDGGGGRPGGLFDNGDAGPLRLFTRQLGGQAGWLLGLAVIGMVAGIMQVGPRRRDPRLHTVVVWAAWLLPAAAFFSVAGFFHSYYLVMLAPPVAGLAAIGLVALWRSGSKGGPRQVLLPAALLAGATVQIVLLRHYPGWTGRLAPPLLAFTVLAALLLTVGRLLHHPIRRVWMMRAAAVAVTAAVFLVPAVWSVETMRNLGGGSLPAGGPPSATDMGGSGGMPGPGVAPAGADGQAALAQDGQRTTDGADAARPDGGPGGSINQAVIDFLVANRADATFLAATASSQTAGPIIIQTGAPVMALGGFSGTDPILTLEQFVAKVQAGEVRYLLVGDGPGGLPPGGASPAAGTADGATAPAEANRQDGGPGGQSAITTWVMQHCTLVPAFALGGTTTHLYDCATAVQGG